MKHSYTFLYCFFALSLVSPAQQCTKLLDFNGSNGAQPYGNLLLTDSIIYGTTNVGGASGTSAGTIFSLKTDGTGYQNLHTFSTGGTLDLPGAYPAGALINSGSTLYGMTSAGGVYGGGVIYSIETDGSNYTKLFDFGEEIDSLIFEGSIPKGALVLRGNFLYGTTTAGGVYGRGTVFKINKNGTGFTSIKSFDGSDGEYPQGELAIDSYMIYGTTTAGGLSGNGTVFSLDSTGYFNKILDFNGSNGKYPVGSLLLYGGTLYGMTSEGGAYGKGVVFSVSTSGSGFTLMHDFDVTDGATPLGSFYQSGTDLIGMTSAGGNSNDGIVFSIQTNGSNFKKLLDFSDGKSPRGTFISDGDGFYSTTFSGGTSGSGIIFRYDDVPTVPICMVSVNDSSTFNRVIWEKPLTTAIDSFIVYRETSSNNYQPVGSVSYSANAEFIDTTRMTYFPFTGNPNAGTYRYKIKSKYTNGQYSDFSPYHNTVFISNSEGTFSWNQYEIQGEPLPLPALSAYVLYRDDNSTGTWHAINAVSGTQTSVTDPDYSSFPSGSWRVETMWSMGCDSLSSRSNIRSLKAPTAVAPVVPHLMELYPNPAKRTITLNFVVEPGIEYLVRVNNTLLQNVYSEVVVAQGAVTKNIDLTALPEGAYFVVLEGYSPQNKKAVKKEVKKLILQ